MSTRTFSTSHVVALVERATRVVPVLWPLESAVAANPLWDLRSHSFTSAVAHARRALGIVGLPPAEVLADAFRAGRLTVADLEAALDDLDNLDQPDGATEAEPVHRGAPAPPPSMLVTVLERHDQLTGGRMAAEVDREVAKYCAAYLGGLLGTSGVVGTGFLDQWRAAVVDDPAARRLGLHGVLEAVAGGPETVIATVLARLVLDEAGAVEELTGQSARLLGWAAHAKWRSRWAAPDHPGPALHLVDYLAVRLLYDLAALERLGHRAGPGACCDHLRPAPGSSPEVPPAALVGGPAGDRLARLDATAAAAVWLAAYEAHYRDDLLAVLERPSSQPSAPPSPGALRAQVVCCIDIRSEGLRRHLEASGHYETFGFAGFFGVPARVWPFDGGSALDLCPVLLHPTVELTEEAGEEAAGAARHAGLRQLAVVERAVETTREGPVASYLLAESAGVGLGPLAVLRTAAPATFARLRRWVLARLAPPVDVHPVLSGPGAPSDDEQALFVETALRTMGLTDRFAPVVVLCGHGSTTENNPYGSALDCGACGAARGGTSARLAAAMSNRAEVRALLAARGIVVPDETLFVAAEHDTATDTVTVFPPAELTPTQADRLAVVERDLAAAGAGLAVERAATLPGAVRRPRRGAARHLATRSADWAQVQPEWGLARCAALVVGPRQLTVGIDLERRTFLHSYDPGTDPDGAALEAILTGPMVVAQWISAAYYHSVVDPDVLGAGDKVSHNVVAGVGVYQGAGGDLRLGLPRQSVFVGDEPFHEPMRLLVVVVAPRERVDTVVARNPVVAELVDGEWVHLAARDDGRFWRRRPGGGWRQWHDARTDAHQLGRPVRLGRPYEVAPTGGHGEEERHG